MKLNINNKRYNSKKLFPAKNIIYGAIAILIFASTTIYYFHENTGSYIVDYRASRDRAFILNMLNKNWHILVDNPNFSMEYILDNRRPSPREDDSQKFEYISVSYKDCNPTGFITYHMKNFYEGGIHLVAVEEKYRGQGIAAELVKEAIKKFKSLGAKKVTLLTREENLTAQKLYTRLGFKEYKRAYASVYYEYKL